jgi:dTDP-4-amino-4,6-dideoxygalactose transaminase
MNVPGLDLKTQYASIRKEMEEKILEVLASQSFVLGPEVAALEKELSDLHETKRAIGVSSGSDAILISLMALGIGEGDSVVTTPFTFFATAGAITRLKARPVFCDIDEKSYNLSPEALRELLEKKIKREGRKCFKAILPVHLYGQCADMDSINDLADEYGMSVIEDACQAVGASYPSRKGVRKACSMGTVGTLSFYPTKNLGGLGDGGMVLTNDEKLGDKIRMLRVHGESNRYYYHAIGGNFRMDALQAAGLRVKLRHFADWQAMRRERAAYYDKKLIESGLCEEGFLKLSESLYKASGIPEGHTYHQYVVRVKDRDAL